MTWTRRAAHAVLRHLHRPSALAIVKTGRRTLEAGRRSWHTVERAAAQGYKRAQLSGAKLARKIISIQQAAGLDPRMIRASAERAIHRQTGRYSDRAFQHGYAQVVSARIPGMSSPGASPAGVTQPPAGPAPSRRLAGALQQVAGRTRPTATPGTAVQASPASPGASPASPVGPASVAGRPGPGAHATSIGGTLARRGRNGAAPGSSQPARSTRSQTVGRHTRRHVREQIKDGVRSERATGGTGGRRTWLTTAGREERRLDRSQRTSVPGNPQVDPADVDAMRRPGHRGPTTGPDRPRVWDTPLITPERESGLKIRSNPGQRSREKEAGQ